MTNSTTKVISIYLFLDSYPSPQFCTVAAAVDGIVGLNSCGIQPDTVHLSCLMSFRGSWKPTMDWSSTSSAGHHALTLGEKLLSNFTMNADEITDDDNFTCYVKYPDGEATSRFRWTLSLDVFCECSSFSVSYFAGNDCFQLLLSVTMRRMWATAPTRATKRVGEEG